MATEPEETAGERSEPETAPKTKKPRAKTATTSKKLIIEKVEEKVETETKKTKTPAAKTRKTKTRSKSSVEEQPLVAAARIDEAPAETEVSAYSAETADDALEGTLEAHSDTGPQQPPVEAAGAETIAEVAETAEDELPAEPTMAPREPGKLDRLQKILSQAGIASRRRAEELITEGRVQVNGQVVTQLGAKADPIRDHIRVDGKLISGAERHRYFVLNKPKGYVTTVSDPEGRPTVMQFFAKMKERLYPVGRLDYQSEGLLLVTNDGELANQLTRAASGVEKTYLVKVAGQPTEQELEQLRSGVAIDREGPGSGKVHTAPAMVRQVRQGENPWFEVVLIEGRNRELRKMFSAIGHFVEKIRRVGYGPLVLDLEPGKFRELEPEELTALRLAAEGKLKPRRLKTTRMLPKEAGKPGSPATVLSRRGGKPSEPSAARRFTQRGFKTPEHAERPFREKKEWKPRSEGFEPNRAGGDRSRPDRFSSDRSRNDRPRNNRTGDERFGNDRFKNDRSGGRSEFGRREAGGSDRFSPKGDRGADRERPFRDRRNAEAGPGRPREGRRDFSFRPQQRDRESQPDGAPRRTWEQRGERPSFKRPGSDRADESTRRFDRPAGKSFDRPAGKSFDGPRNKSFSKPFGKPFAKPAGRGFDKPSGRGFDAPAGRSFAKPAGSLDKSPNKSWTKPGARPGGAGRPPAGNRSKPSFGARPSGGRPSGFKRTGPPRGGPRPGSRSGPRPGGRSGGPKRG